MIPKPSQGLPLVILFGFAFIFSLQQCCISSIADLPNITYRYWICLYCLNGFILEIIIFLHFKNPTNAGLLAAYRVQLLISTVVALAIAYKFITSIIEGVYAAQHNTKTNVKKAPKWFQVGVLYLTRIQVFIVIIIYVSAFIFANGIIFDIYDIIQPIYILLASIMVIKATFQVRRNIIKIVYAKNSNFGNKRSTLKSKGIFRTSSSIKKPQKSDGSDVLVEMDNKLLQLYKGLRKINLILICFVLISVTQIVILYLEINGLISIIKKHTFYVPANEPPFQSILVYLFDKIFDIILRIVYISWVYIGCKKYSDIPANSLYFICCPWFDFSGKSEEYFKNIGVTIDINGKPLDNGDKITESEQNGMQELNIEQSFQNINTDKLFVNNNPKMSNGISNLNNNLHIQNHYVSNTFSKMTTPMPMNETDPRVMVFDFENSFMIKPGEIITDRVIPQFGGVSRITKLKSKLSKLANKNKTLFVKSNLNDTYVVTQTLKELDIIKYFISSDNTNENTNSNLITRIFGSDHQYVGKLNNSNSMLILKIMELLEVTHDDIIYIDNESNIDQLNKINLCKTHAIKTKQGLKDSDWMYLSYHQNDGMIVIDEI